MGHASKRTRDRNVKPKPKSKFKSQAPSTATVPTTATASGTTATPPPNDLAPKPQPRPCNHRAPRNPFKDFKPPLDNGLLESSVQNTLSIQDKMITRFPRAKGYSVEVVKLSILRDPNPMIPSLTLTNGIRRIDISPNPCNSTSTCPHHGGGVSASPHSLPTTATVTLNSESAATASPTGNSNAFGETKATHRFPTHLIVAYAATDVPERESYGVTVHGAYAAPLTIYCANLSILPESNPNETSLSNTVPVIYLGLPCPNSLGYLLEFFNTRNTLCLTCPWGGDAPFLPPSTQLVFYDEMVRNARALGVEDELFWRTLNERWREAQSCTLLRVNLSPIGLTRSKRTKASSRESRGSSDGGSEKAHKRRKKALQPSSAINLCERSAQSSCQ